MGRKRKPSLPQEPQLAHVTDLTHEGLGVAHIDGKAVFISAALPGEDVEFIYTNKTRKHDEGVLHRVIKPSELRVEAKCVHFSVCGGCNLQHLAPESQIQQKHKILLDNLQRIGHVTPAHVRDPITGPQWGYRRKARLGVKYVAKKEKVLVGFREKASRYLADLSRCEILHPSVGEHLTDLSQLVASLSCYNTIPQIEVAVGDDSTALVFRHLEPLAQDDRQKLIDFAQQQHVDVYLQSGGPDTIVPLWPQSPSLYYLLDEYAIRHDFLPSDFVQVNAEINRRIVPLVIAALECDAQDNVLELFCGLGNFTLPIARHVKHVTAVEGDKGLIERARINAQTNAITNVEYHVANLMEETKQLPWWNAHNYKAVFLDPPRSGAEQVLPLIAAKKIAKIVYVSCNPATLARDAGILVNQFGYRLDEAGVMDMFPHTAHVESIAVFTHPSHKR